MQSSEYIVQSYCMKRGSCSHSASEDRQIKKAGHECWMREYRTQEIFHRAEIMAEQDQSLHIIEKQ